MRTKAAHGPLSVQAIGGSNVVTLGFDHEPDAMAGVHGFAVQRIDHTEGQRRWLPNKLRFAGVARWTTDWNPLQTFTWGDYTAKPDHEYTYRVHTTVGTPGRRLERRTTVALRVDTQPEDRHGVWFNRGAISSPAYVQRFHNQHPADVANREAWRWLSRGLEEALLAFIGQATDERWSLHGALYEFRYGPVLEAFAVAADSGADVHLVVDDESDNHDAVDEAGIDGLVDTWRKHAKLPHNKFVVASRDGVPVAVWTGSTNITENGIFGQSNVGHRVRDAEVAARYLAYWQQLRADPTPGTLNDWVDAENPLPDAWPTGTTVVFSPHTGLKPLERYVAEFARADHLVCATFPFRLDSRFGDLLPGDHPALRWLLFEDPGRAQAAAERVTDADTTIVAGAFIPEGGLAGWAGELKNPLSNNVEYVHSKYLLVDPLGDDPLVITGSANFSGPSTNENDENMLVVRGDTEVADTYFTDFMRLFSHYRFRYTLQLHPAAPTPGPETGVVAPVGLDPTDDWWPKYFDEPARAKQRRLLAGTG